VIAGQLDRRLTLVRASTVEDAFGGETSSVWSAVSTFWGSRYDVSDGERARAAQVGSFLTTRFQVRFSPIASTITAKDRIECDGEVFEVTGVKLVGRRDGVEITATALKDG
jgi:SPP1 family predicted phage head-tail adaptor